MVLYQFLKVLFVVLVLLFIIIKTSHCTTILIKLDVNLILIYLSVTRVLLIVSLQLIQIWINSDVIQMKNCLLHLLDIVIECYSIILLLHLHQQLLYRIAIELKWNLILLLSHLLITRVLWIILIQLQSVKIRVDMDKIQLDYGLLHLQLHLLFIVIQHCNIILLPHYHQQQYCIVIDFIVLWIRFLIARVLLNILLQIIETTIEICMNIDTIDLNYGLLYLLAIRIAHYSIMLLSQCHEQPPLHCDNTNTKMEFFFVFFVFLALFSHYNSWTGDNKWIWKSKKKRFD